MATVTSVSDSELRAWGLAVRSPNIALVKRAQAMWGLRHAKETLATQLLADYVVQVVPPSPAANALLQHEAAYCLGQRGDVSAVNALETVLRDVRHEAIVRHEAAEALAALASCPDVDRNRIHRILTEFVDCAIVEVAETCQIGLGRVNWLADRGEFSHQQGEETALVMSRFPNTIDPTPAFDEAGDQPKRSIAELKSLLLSSTVPLFSRYQALFSLRNASVMYCTDAERMTEIIDALSAALVAPDSALLRHEVAFILGQLSIAETGEALLQCLVSPKEHPMVRHEAAMALGEVVGVTETGSGLAGANGPTTDFVDRARHALVGALNDSEPVVRDSCALALDIADYVVSADRFQYAVVPQAPSA